jgi:hypothetical protein
MWSIEGATSKDARIIALWMNSTLHLCQVLLEKIQDIWIDIHEYTLKSLLILNPRAISDNESEHLLGVFDAVRRVRFPSLEQQIKSRFQARVQIDSALLQVLGFKDKEAKRFLSTLYDTMTQEFEALKALGGGEEDN